MQAEILLPDHLVPDSVLFRPLLSGTYEERISSMTVVEGDVILPMRRREEDSETKVHGMAYN
jgi:hypothetical protein